MNKRRSVHKKLSFQIPKYNFANEDEFKKLTPKSLMHTETSSENESEAAIHKIITGLGNPTTIPEFESPIKLIQANTSAKTRFQETKKNLLKMKLMQRLKNDSFAKAASIFQDPVPKNKSKTYGCAPSHFPKPEKSPLDESLVNLESEDPSTIFQQNW